jgi:hypothetical protein
MDRSKAAPGKVAPRSLRSATRGRWYKVVFFPKKAQLKISVRVFPLLEVVVFLGGRAAASLGFNFADSERKSPDQNSRPEAELSTSIYAAFAQLVWNE